MEVVQSGRSAVREDDYVSTAFEYTLAVDVEPVPTDSAAHAVKPPAAATVVVFANVVSVFAFVTLLVVFDAVFVRAGCQIVYFALQIFQVLSLPNTVKQTGRHLDLWAWVGVGRFQTRWWG